MMKNCKNRPALLTTALVGLTLVGLSGCSNLISPDEGPIKQEFIDRGFTKPTVDGNSYHWNLGVGTCRIHVTVSETATTINYRTDDGTVVTDITAAKLLALPAFSSCTGEK